MKLTVSNSIALEGIPPALASEIRDATWALPPVPFDFVRHEISEVRGG